MTYRLIDDIMDTLDTLDKRYVMKKATIDNLGRIVIPIGWRRELNLTKNSILELSFDGEKIIIEKEKLQCKLCGSKNNILGNFRLCSKCISKIKEITL